MTGHKVSRVTVTVECSCGACGDRVLACDSTPAADALVAAAAEAWVDHLRVPPRPLRVIGPEPL